MLKNRFFKIYIFSLLFIVSSLFSNDLEEIRKKGELRHIGVPYSNFVTGLGYGLDVELIKGFSEYLGVKYKFVPSNWSKIFGDLIGQNVENGKDGAVYLEKVDIKGDLIANGLTILPWREEVINFSTATFPSGVWLMTRSDSKINPIKPTKSIDKDISLVKDLLIGKSVLAIENTCLDPRLYNLKEIEKLKIIIKKEKKFEPIDLIPVVLDNVGDSTLIDIPDALLALEKWPGELKVIGPVSNNQAMGVAFRKNSSELLKEFNKYFKKIKDDGTYNKLVEKYYPDVFQYYEDFFK